MSRFIKLLLLCCCTLIHYSYAHASTIKLTEQWQTINGIQYNVDIGYLPSGDFVCECHASCYGEAPEVAYIPGTVEYDFTEFGKGAGETNVVDFRCEDIAAPCPTKVVYLPSTVKYISLCSIGLEEVHIDSNNPYFSSIDGLLLSKDGKALLRIPGGRKNINVPEGVTVVGDGERGLSDCRSSEPPILETISFPSSCVKISDSAFSSCQNLREVNLDENIESIGKSALSYCTALQEIELPKSVQYIGIRCFERCESLTAINVDKDNANFTSIDGVLYSKDGKTLLSFPSGHSTEHTIAMGTEIIGPYAFAENRILKKVIFPKSLRSVGEYAFWSCFYTKDGTVIFNEGLESIEPYAFQYCLISKISLPSTLKNIGTGALRLCSWKKLVCKAVNPPICEKEALYYMLIDYSDRKVVVPVKSIAKYKNSPEWENLPIGSAFSTINHLKIKDNPKYVYQNEVVIADESMDGFKWTTSNPDIAYVNESGLVVSMGRIGNCVLSLMYEDEVVDSILFEATEPGTTANVPAQVAHSSADNTTTQKVVIDGISSDNSMLNVHLEPALRADNLTWSSSDESVATIDHGIISFKDSSKNVTFTVEDRAGNVASYEYSGEASSISDFSEGTINPEDSRETQLYNLNGIPVTNPSPGVYIRKKGSDISKVLIK